MYETYLWCLYMYIHSYNNTRCMLTLESMSQSADEEFFLVDYVHQFHVDSSILQWWILQIYIGIILICRCIIIQNNCEIKQYLAFSVSKLNSIVIKLFKVLLVKESACKYPYMYCFLLKKNYLQNLNYYIDLNLYPYNFFVMK